MSDSLEERAADAGAQRDASMSRDQRRVHGVVHTPAVVARWALSRVDACLRASFGLPGGVGDPRVVLFDPAVGTGVWLAAAMSIASDAAPVTAIGIDVDATALETARSVLDARTSELGWSLRLHEGNALAQERPFAEHHGVRVIVGNPPWAARSQSRGTALSDAWLRDFRQEDDGSALREQRTGVLSDDYVRFFRWSLEQARTAEQGAIVCLATNQSYLDGPVHRAMRRELCASFDAVELLDLGGNALLSRGEARDENVFGVRVGAAITMAVRLPHVRERRAQVTYVRLRGRKVDKLSALSRGEQLASVSFTPSSPGWLFVPERARDHDRETFSIARAFPFHREGVQTNRDALCIDVDRGALLARLWQLARGELQVAASRHFDPQAARLRLAERLAASEDEVVTTLAYRPFDARFVCTVAPICHRPRLDLLAACAQSSLCLMSARKDRGDAPWSLLGVARHAADGCFLSTRSSCRTRVWPNRLADGTENVDAVIAGRLAQLAGVDVSAELLMAYVCGVLISPRYRAQHSETLKRDYPEVPWPRDAQAFQGFAEAGRAWIDAWLSPDLQTLDHSDQDNCLQADNLDSLRALRPDLHELGVGHFRLLSLLKGRPGAGFKDVLNACERVSKWEQAGRLADIAHLKNRTV